MRLLKLNCPIIVPVQYLLPTNLFQDLAGSPQRQFYMSGGGQGYHQSSYQPAPPTSSDPSSPSHAHSYAQQVGYFLQQPVAIPTVQSGGPRTTPSGYPGGPIVPSGQLSPKMNRRYLPGQEPYSDNVLRTSAPVSSGPMTFTRALEVTDSLAGAGVMRGANGGIRQQPAEEDHRESVYDMNYEISV